MLYLIAMVDGTKNFVESGHYLIKVGTTRNLKTRLNQYKSYNPGCWLVSTCNGTETMEKKAHKQLYSIGERIPGTEWATVDSNTWNRLLYHGLGFFAGMKNVKIYKKPLINF